MHLSKCQMRVSLHNLVWALALSLIAVSNMANANSCASYNRRAPTDVRGLADKVIWS